MDSLHPTATIEDVALQTVDELPKGLSALLREVHDVVRRSLQSMLREWSKAPVEVVLNQEIQAPYSEFTRSLTVPVAIAALQSPALASNMLICLDGPMASSLTDMLLGGQVREAVDRWPTSTDKAIRAKALEDNIWPLHEAFLPVMELDAKITRFESSPNFVFDIDPDDPVIVYRFSASLGDNPMGDISIIYSFAALQPLLDRIPAGNVEPLSSVEPAVVDLHKVEVELKAITSPTSISVGEFLSLRPGDVLVLDQWADQPNVGMVNGVPLFEISVGAFSGHVAAVVERWKE